MDIGVAITDAVADADGNTVDETVRLGRQAAEAGLRSVWLGQRLDYDSVALAGIVGREVPGLAVGTAAVPIFARHPILVSSQAQTAQAATHGRYTLGLALGSKAMTETAFGEPHDRPIRRLREFLTALRSLLADGTADFHGEILTAVTPIPAAVAGATPPVPVLVAAMGPQALRAAGELADGTLPLFVTPKVLAEHIVPPITEAAARSGRAAPRITVFVPAVVTLNVAAARAAAITATAFYDRVPSYQRVTALAGASRTADLVTLGDEQTVAAAVRNYFDAGATEVIATQTNLLGEQARLRTWQLFGELARG
ncbi:MAG: TIGR03564 family F420-dependent LLM class oxidoreductase [Streptosporangiaceae bacterium]|jgi:F420-dependent oxidoreductase-like protein